MRHCKACYEPITYSGFGRPREYCDDCRQWVKHRPEPTCDWCGWDFEGGGEWQQYCGDECRDAAKGEVWEVEKPPLPVLAVGRGPWVWEVGERYLITRKPVRPKNAGQREAVRCGIMADFADRTTAETYAQQQAQRRAS